MGFWLINSWACAKNNCDNLFKKQMNKYKEKLVILQLIGIIVIKGIIGGHLHLQIF